MKLDHDTHTFSLRVEWNELCNLRVAAFNADFVHCEEIASKSEESGFRLGSNVDDVAIFFRLEGGRVDGDGSPPQSDNIVRQGLSEFGCRNIVDLVVELCARIGIAGSHLYVRTIAKPAGSSKGSSNNSHDVLCECTSLVRAYTGSITHGLTRSHDTHEIVVLQHALRRESQGERHSKWQTLGDRDNNNGDSDNQNVQETLTTFSRSLGVVWKPGEELDQ